MIETPRQAGENELALMLAAADHEKPRDSFDDEDLEFRELSFRIAHRVEQGQVPFNLIVGSNPPFPPTASTKEMR